MTTPERWLEKHNRKLLMDRSAPGRIGASLAKLDVPESELPDAALLRDNLEMPEVSESEIVRYFSQLSHYNFSIDHNFYPLGSCTMKYNPKINDEMAALPGLSEIHPFQPEATVQGALKLVWHLQEILAEVMGMREPASHPRREPRANSQECSWRALTISLAATTSARKC